MVTHTDSLFDASVATNASGVSWCAIFAGAAAAAALSLILLILGFGLGLSSVSPWAHAGASAATIGVATIVWLSITQILASGLGGYLSGRLRVKWSNVHTDEVFFRDTAHGFLSWAIATLVTAACLSSAMTNVLGSAVETGAKVTAVSTVAMVSNGDEVGGSNTLGYFVDGLFRGPNSAAHANDAATKAEATRIFLMDLQSKQLPAADKQYLGQLVAARSGISQADAEARVADVFDRTLQVMDNAKVAADKARKAAAYSALWMFVALLLGAFFASWTATWGGRQRDRVAYLA